MSCFIALEKKCYLPAGHFPFIVLKKNKANFDSVALMYIQSTSFGISKLRFTPGKEE